MSRHFLPISGSPDWGAGVVAKHKMLLDGMQRRNIGKSRYIDIGGPHKVFVDGEDDFTFIARMGGYAIGIRKDGTFKKVNDSKIIFPVEICINNWVNYNNSHYCETKYGVTYYNYYNSFRYPVELKGKACFTGNGKYISTTIQFNDDSLLNSVYHRSFYFKEDNYVHIFYSLDNTVRFFDKNGNNIKNIDLHALLGINYYSFNSSVNYDANLVCLDFSMCFIEPGNNNIVPPAAVVLSFNYSEDEDGNIHYDIEVVDKYYETYAGPSDGSWSTYLNGSWWSAFTGRGNKIGGLELAFYKEFGSSFDYETEFLDTREHTGGYLPYKPFVFDMRKRLYYAAGGTVVMDGVVLYDQYGAYEIPGSPIYYGYPNGESTMAAYSARKNQVVMYFPDNNTTRLCSLDSKKTDPVTGEVSWDWVTVCDGNLVSPVPCSKEMSKLLGA